MSLFDRLRRAAVCLFTDHAAPDLFELLNHAWIGQAVYAATASGAIDALASRPKTAAEAAEARGGSPAHTEQILRALAAFGLLTRDSAGRFALTAYTKGLTRGANSWLREYVLLWGEQLYPAAGEMAGMAATGDTAFARHFGVPLYEHYRKFPQASARFVNFMNAVTDWQRQAIVAAIDFSKHRHVVDVGGGRASFITAILAANPHLQGTILDQPHMAEIANERISAAGLADRCRFVPGSFLESVPGGGDFYIIKHVLHDWADRDMVTILRNIAAAMSPDAKLAIVEGVLHDRPAVDRLLVLRDLEQMIWTGGAVRTRDQFERILGEGGLRLTGIEHTKVADAALIFAAKGRS